MGAFMGQRLIVVLSDSLSLPRVEPEVVCIEEAYPSLLAKKFDQVINVGYGAATSDNILWQSNYFKTQFMKPIVVFNFGIVDCTPRSLNKYESLILRKLSIRLPNAMANWLRSIRLVRKVSPVKFRENCIRIRDLDLGDLIVLPIAPASEDFEREVPRVQESIKLYNNILKDVFMESFCDTQLSAELHIMSDHHHLNPLGHQKVFNAIAARVAKLI